MTIGKSPARTFRLERPGLPTLYLKTAKASAPGDCLVQEKAVLDWLRGKLPVPEALDWAHEGGEEHLLLSAVPGTDAATRALSADVDKAALARTLGQALRTLHALPTADCPFDWRLDAFLEKARRNVHNGLVDEADFDDDNLGKTAEEVFQEVLRLRPAVEDLVFTHGDYCLPNVILDRDRVSGFIDLGRAGIGDRYRDNALGIRSLRDNGGQGFEDDFFTGYGLAAPDWAKIEFFILLDELF